MSLIIQTYCLQSSLSNTTSMFDVKIVIIVFAIEIRNTELFRLSTRVRRPIFKFNKRNRPSKANDVLFLFSFSYFILSVHTFPCRRSARMITITRVTFQNQIVYSRYFELTRFSIFLGVSLKTTRELQKKNIFIIDIFAFSHFFKSLKCNTISDVFHALTIFIILINYDKSLASIKTVFLRTQPFIPARE